MIWQIRPDLVIETGVARGGSQILSASIIELVALCGGPAGARVLGIDADPLHEERRPHAAASLARALDSGGGPVVVVLKGARTVVADGERWWRCERPNPALATGGSGDVLAGVIGGLLAQFHPRAGARANDITRDAFELACIGVELHSLAGMIRSRTIGDAGLLAHELADSIPEARGLIQSIDE